MTVAELFDRSAQRYDQTRRQLLPCFDDLYGAALRLLPDDRALPLRVLDIGAGTGLLSGLVAATYPRAELTLVDIAGDMLQKAAERLRADAGRVRIMRADMTELAGLGPFDAVVSSLAIHHLDDMQKRALFGQIYAMLVDGGRFVHVEQVLGPNAAIEARYQRIWLEEVRARGVAEADLAAALERMAQDRAAPLAEQLAWLAEAGFADMHCWYQWYRFVVYSGDKPAERA
jgi:tRNA (cmo5U34)-methyltransferase